MGAEPHLSIKAMIIWAPLISFAVLCVGTLLILKFGRPLGFSYRDALIVTLFTCPLLIFSSLYGFYKAMVRHYGFKGEERLFFF